ncbi:hypothetical protein EVAR_5826_1 [Eumeta japonica]|uniref:Uncharacterized protein n=1 Tax=Eumeta variegata TaxID=151549 RepID=A0A4C1T5C5_EUMVA|nr:hypothetical protein EVAR_5826_1 [Eumeta japonica]
MHNSLVCAADRSWLVGERRKAFGGLSRSVTHRYVTERYTFFISDSANLRRCHVKIKRVALGDCRARLDPCELRTVVPYKSRYANARPSYMVGGVGGVRCLNARAPTAPRGRAGREGCAARARAQRRARSACTMELLLPQ